VEKVQWDEGNAIIPLPIYDSKRSPTADCYNARAKHITTNRAQCTSNPAIYPLGSGARTSL